MQEVFVTSKINCQRLIRRYNSRRDLGMLYETDSQKPKKGRHWVLLLLAVMAFYVFFKGAGSEPQPITFVNSDGMELELQDLAVDNVDYDEHINMSLEENSIGNNSTVRSDKTQFDTQDLTVDNINDENDDQNLLISAVKKLIENTTTTGLRLEAIIHSRRQRIQETNVDKMIDKVGKEINSNETINTTEPTKSVDNNNTLLICEVNESKVPLQLNMNVSKVSVSSNELYPMIKQGGYYIPTECYSKDQIAIVVPYRSRPKNLAIFLINIHAFLMSQNIEYRIFVIEQYGTGTFNKGRLLNAGFKEVQKYGRWRCVIFHDVDLLPLSPSVRYTCPSSPRHMSSLVLDKNSERNTSSTILFGGVTAISLEHYKMANGHSNVYWGWGGEDYDMFWRLRAAGLPVERNSQSAGKYLALPHKPMEDNKTRYRLLKTAQDRWRCEGLNTVQYSVVGATAEPLCTRVVVDVYRRGDLRGGHDNPFLSKLEKFDKFLKNDS